MSANEQPPSNQPSKSLPMNVVTTYVAPEIVEHQTNPAGRPSRRIHTEPDLVFDEIVESATRKSVS